MADEPDSLIPRLLRAMNRKVDAVTRIVNEIDARLTSIESALGQLETLAEAFNDYISQEGARLDCIEAHLVRIDQHLRS
jgi:hypothetical protein